MTTRASKFGSQQLLTKSQKIRGVRVLGRPKLTRERALELLSYDPDTGIFRHRTSRGGKKAGDIAGTIGPAGYRLIFLDYFQWKASHLAWLIMTGKPRPRGRLIDHKDGDRANDRWVNLRAATYAENARNRRISVRNKTGRVGVYPISVDLFGATICVDRRNIHLGRFRCLDEAIEARCAAEKHYFGEFAADAMYWRNEKDWRS